MALNDLVYVGLSIVFAAVVAFLILHNRRVRLKAEELRRNGFHPQSLHEEILLAERALSPSSHPGPLTPIGARR